MEIYNIDTKNQELCDKYKGCGCGYIVVDKQDNILDLWNKEEDPERYELPEDFLKFANKGRLVKVEFSCYQAIEE